MAEKLISFESTEALLAVFGSYDENVRLLEKEFQVTIVSRDGQIKISGEPDEVNMAAKTVEALLEMVKGNDCDTINI